MEYYELRDQIKKGIVALVSIQANRAVKNENDRLYVDGIYVPLHFDYGETVAVRIGSASRRDGVLRTKKDGSFPYSKIVAIILGYVDNAKRREEEQRKEREVYEVAQQFAKNMGGYNREARYSVVSYYDGSAELEMKATKDELAQIEPVVTLIKMIRQPNSVAHEEINKLLAILTAFQEGLGAEEAAMQEQIQAIES